MRGSHDRGSNRSSVSPRARWSLGRGASLLCLSLGFGLGLAALGCQTYRQDLGRAQAHYAASRYEAALALLRPLERDLGALSSAEQARYAYVRGMTDFRLAAVTVRGADVADPKASFRAHARHWLALARALEERTPGSLQPSEKERMTSALDELNQEVYAEARGLEPASSAGEGEGEGQGEEAAEGE
jgi:hypothetical protein